MDVFRARTAPVLAALALVAASAAGCAPTTADGAATPSATSSATMPATPSPAPTLDIPDAVEGEIARAVYSSSGGTDDSPVNSSILTDILRADEPFSVEGECIGDRLDYRVIRAEVGNSGDTIAEGTIVCGEPVANGSFSTPYEGPAQLSITSTDGIDAAWIVLVATTP